MQLAQIGAITSVTEAAWQDLVACGKADDLVTRAWQLRDSMACLRRSSAGWMPARMGRLSNGVGHRHPVTMWSVSLIAVLMMGVCTLRHQISAQYSAVEYTRLPIPIHQAAS